MRKDLLREATKTSKKFSIIAHLAYCESHDKLHGLIHLFPYSISNLHEFLISSYPIRSLVLYMNFAPIRIGWRMKISDEELLIYVNVSNIFLEIKLESKKNWFHIVRLALCSPANLVGLHFKHSNQKIHSDM